MGEMGFLSLVSTQIGNESSRYGFGMGCSQPGCAYTGVAELSLYISAQYRGKGIGSTLLAALIESSEKAGIWTLQGGIFPENTASLCLVKKHGFREIGRRERIGFMTHGDLAGKWRDVILVERRSKVVGAG